MGFQTVTVGIFCVILNLIFIDAEVSDVFTKTSSKRHRRAADLFPVFIESSFSYLGQPFHFRLKRSDTVHTNIPVYVQHNGRIQTEVVKQRPHKVFYHDVRHLASVSVSCAEGNIGDCRYILKGQFIHNNSQHSIEPHPDAPKGHDPKMTRLGLPHIIYLDNEKINFGNDFIYKDEDKRETSEKTAKTQSRQKRAATTLHVELLAVVDFAIYNFWYQRSNAGTSILKDEEAKAEIREFYAYVINAMQVRYQSIISSLYNINIVFGGIFIADEEAAAPWTEIFKVQASPRPQVNSGNALDMFKSWLSTAVGLPGYDHAMLFTGYDLESGGSLSNAGLAYVSGTCSDVYYGSSIVEDRFNAGIGVVAAHELGHNLGASHDGSSNACLADDKYIMSPSSGGITDDRAVNGWIFSPCSVTYFEDYIGSLASNCMTSFTASYNPNALDEYMNTRLGQIYSLDDQCRIVKDNPDSFFCRNFHTNTSTVCGYMYCSYGDGSGYCSTALAWEGSSCGNGMWCEAGVCVQDSLAPSLPDNCPFGDNPGIVYNGMTCSELINPNPIYCYQSFYFNKCCGSCTSQHTGRIGCEYGDKASGCQLGSCPYYSQDTIDNGCCGTCYVPPSTISGQSTTSVPMTTPGISNVPADTTTIATQLPQSSTVSLEVTSITPYATPEVTLTNGNAVSSTPFSQSEATSASPTTEGPVCNGDNQYVTIGGLPCPDAVTESPYICYQSNLFDYCCASCLAAKRNEAGCEYGDRNAQINGLPCLNATQESPNVCYSSTSNSYCCESCRNVNIGIVGCEYGDRSSSCDAASCANYDAYSRDVVCCLTCSAQSTSASTTHLQPTTQPPQTQQPTTQPLQTQQPSTQPPQTQQPTTQPPQTQQTTTQPPQTQQTTTQPQQAQHTTTQQLQSDATSASLTTEGPVCNGDNQYVTIGGLPCQDAVTETPYICYQSNLFDYCCASCLAAKRNEEGCEYGDRNAQINGLPCLNATQESPYVCYSLTSNSYCCESCRNVNIGIVGCEYGDRSSSCDAANCANYDAYSRDVVCCLTCNYQSNGTSTIQPPQTQQLTSQPPQTQPPTTQPPQTQQPTTQTPQTQHPTTQPPQTQQPTAKPPTTQQPTTQPQQTQKPTTQPPQTQQPTTLPPTTQQPTTQPPQTQQPTTQPPQTQQPTTLPPTTQQPTTQPPQTQQPTNQPPQTQQPTTQTSQTQKPTTQPPQTQQPTTQQPQTQQPTTQTPQTQQPTTQPQQTHQPTTQPPQTQQPTTGPPQPQQPTTQTLQTQQPTTLPPQTHQQTTQTPQTQQPTTLSPQTQQPTTQPQQTPQPTTQPPQTQQPTTGPPQPQQPTTQTLQTQQPTTLPPQTHQPTTQTPQTQQPTTQQPQTQQPTTQTPQTQQPTTQPQQTHQPTTQPPQTQQPTTGPPQPQQPTTQTLQTQQPTTLPPQTHQPTTQTPQTQQPTTLPPQTQQPTTQPPQSQQPTTQPPQTQQTTTQTQQPTTQPSQTQQPTTQTQQPTTQPPQTQQPTTQPSQTQQPTTQTQQPTTQPPQTQQPTTQPQQTQQPTTQPQQTQQPITQPPQTQQPTTQAPQNQPQSTVFLQSATTASSNIQTIQNIVPNFDNKSRRNSIDCLCLLYTIFMFFLLYFARV